MSQKIMVFGDKEFTLGFRLAGVKDCVEVTDENRVEVFQDLVSSKENGIAVLNQKDVDLVPERIREDVENSISPTTVTISDEYGAEETLRKMILKSIGVDLWEN